MVSVEYGNILYFIPIVALAATAVLLCLLCGKMGQKWTLRFVLIMAWANFALHFLKQFAPSYIEAWPTGLARSTMENLCAVMVVLTPFALLSKKKVLLDYLYYMGIVSASLAFLAPTGAVGLNLGDPGDLFEVTRYYLCHAPIFLTGLLLVSSGAHRLDYHRLIHVPFLVIAALIIIALDDVVLNAVLYRRDWMTLLDRDQPIFNSSFLFGPSSEVDESFGWAYNYLIPGLQTYRVDGVLHFTPILWVVPYLFIATLLLGPLLALPSELRHMKMDWAVFAQKRRMARMKKEIQRMEEQQ